MSEEKIKHIIEVFQNDYCEKCSEFNCLEGSMEEIITAMKQLQQQNQKYKEVIDKAINDLNIIIDIVREQPLGSDCWIIDRLEANKNILKEVE